MRVLHWFPNFLAGGGVTNSVIALAQAQAAARAEVLVVTLPHEETMYGALDQETGIQVVIWNGGRVVRSGAVGIHGMRRNSWSALRKLSPEIVHVHGEFNPDNWWAARLWTCPIVLTPHGAFHPAVLARGGRAKSLYVAVARRALYEKVSRFHALSPAEEGHIVAALPTVETYSVPQGPSPAVRDALGRDRPAVHPHGGPVRFLFVGRIDVRTKGLDLLVEAFACALHATHSRRSATLTLVGPDWRDGVRPLRALALRLGVADRVEIRDRVTGDEVPALLESADVYVQLSRNEGSPLSLNDALALGKPVIVSDRVGTASCREIANLAHVIVVEPSVKAAARAIAGALMDLDRLQIAAGDSYPLLRNFLSWDRASERHLEVYESLIGTRC